MKYQCKKCKNIVDLTKTTSIIKNNKVVTKEAYCKKCNLYMDYIREHAGMPTNVLRFDILSPNDKKKKLKERSNQHFQKHIKEKKRILDTNHLRK